MNFSIKKLSNMVSIALLLAAACNTPQNSTQVEWGIHTCDPYLWLNKMNVLYVGVENPITINGSTRQPQPVVLHSPTPGVEIIPMPSQPNRYFVKVKKPGECILSIRDEGGKDLYREDFRAKRIPDPVAKLGARWSGGEVTAAEMHEQKGVTVLLENFDFDARCVTDSFQITRLQKGGQSIVIRQNAGVRFEAANQALIEQAQSGDYYIFDKIRCTCPGDTRKRNLPGIAIKVL
jgi:hypothetical protein